MLSHKHVFMAGVKRKCYFVGQKLFFCVTEASLLQSRMMMAFEVPLTLLNYLNLRPPLFW